MLTQLSTVKDRLAIAPADTTYDALLTNALNALSVRFDNETNRTLARTVNATHEFNAEEAEIRVACYPLESISKFEVKPNEADGWLLQSNISYLIRRGCVVSLASALGSWRQHGRVTYTGGYVLPGTTPGAGQGALPSDLEQAEGEQAA